MIKAIITDIDGVIVGDKTGLNFPLPHQSVIEKLKDLCANGMQIILCTAKFNYAIQDIIKSARLDNPHITDGGALIVNPIEDKIIKKYVINKKIVKSCTKEFIQKNIYFELYTPQSYFLQKSQVCAFTAKRTSILQIEPVLVDSLIEIAESEDIIKMLAFTVGNKDILRIESILKQFGPDINFIWSAHPYISPSRSSVITAPNVSKAEAAKEIVKILGLSFDEILGIGDTAGDWGFMQYCKYAATLENGDKKIKELIKTKGEDNYFIAPHINENGIFDILRYFDFRMRETID